MKGRLVYAVSMASSYLMFLYGDAVLIQTQPPILMRQVFRGR